MTETRPTSLRFVCILFQWIVATMFAGFISHFYADCLKGESPNILGELLPLHAHHIPQIYGSIIPRSILVEAASKSIIWFCLKIGYGKK